MGNAARCGVAPPETCSGRNDVSAHAHTWVGPYVTPFSTGDKKIRRRGLFKNVF